VVGDCGHAHVQSTMSYVGVARDRLRSEYALFVPSYL
jgi:hypothetical protein